MTRRWLNAREWLEYERLTGLPHADFAADILNELTELDELTDGTDDRIVLAEALKEVAESVKDLEGKTEVDRVETAVQYLDDLVDIFGGDRGTVVEMANAADERFWAIWAVLEESGLVDRNDKTADVDIPGLLRMFLPC